MFLAAANKRVPRFLSFSRTTNGSISVLTMTSRSLCPSSNCRPSSFSTTKNGYPMNKLRNIYTSNSISGFDHQYDTRYMTLPRNCTNVYAAKSIRRALASSASGQETFQKYLDASSQYRILLDEQEREKSKKMYQAWESASRKEDEKQAAATNPNRKSKNVGVAVVKTLVKQLKQEKREEQAKSKALADCQEQALNFLEEAALTCSHPTAMVVYANHLFDELNNQNGTTSSNNGSPESEQLRQQQRQLLGRIIDLYQRSKTPEGWFNAGNLLWTGYPSEDGDSVIVDNDDDNKSDSPVLLPPNRTSAMEAFQRAIALGDADAMYFVGVQKLTVEENNLAGIDNIEDQQLAGLELIESAAYTKEGHTGAAYYLALFYLNGDENLGIEPCTQKFMKHLAFACDGSSRNGMKNRNLNGGNNEADTSVGGPEALFLRGHCFYHGNSGYPVDRGRALEDFLRAADLGHADAAVSAGAMLFSTNSGVVQDQVKAFQLYQLAGELGSREGWRNVVACYATGQGVTQSTSTAKYIAKIMLKEGEDE